MRRKELSILLLLVVLCIIVAGDESAVSQCGKYPEHEPTDRHLRNLQHRASAFVIITGGIDLSVGSMFALLGVLLSMMLTEWHWSASLSLP
jgi:hypothetical protein